MRHYVSSSFCFCRVETLVFIATFAIFALYVQIMYQDGK